MLFFLKKIVSLAKLIHKRRASTWGVSAGLHASLPSDSAAVTLNIPSVKAAGIEFCILVPANDRFPFHSVCIW